MTDRLSVTFAIKAEISDPQAKTFVFTGYKTMYGGKQVAAGDRIFLFASENEGGHGLFACGVVTSAEAVPRKPDLDRQTPRVSITIHVSALARQKLGRKELKPFSDWDDGQPQTELNFKFYRQARDKVIAVSEKAVQFLDGFF